MLTKFAFVATVLLSSALVTSATFAEASTDSIVNDLLTNSSGVEEASVRATGGCWRVAMAVDLTGGDVGYLNAKDPNPCIAHCRKTDACDMFTHTDYDGGRCWLKKANGPYKGAARPGAASLIFTKPCKNVDVSLGKCEMTDRNMDIGTQRAPAASGCYGICSKMETSTAFTWTNYNGGTCWLKSYMTDCKPSATGESGSVPY